MYVDSKKFDKKLENVRWSTGEDALFAKLGKYLEEKGADSFETVLKTKMKEFKRLKKDIDKIRALSFNQIMRRDYKSYTYDLGVTGFAVVQGKRKDVFKNKKWSSEKFKKKLDKFMKEENL